jgi:hypothetical protein
MTTIERMGLLVARYGLSQYHCNDDDADDQTDAAIAAESHAAHTALLTAIRELVEDALRYQWLRDSDFHHFYQPWQGIDGRGQHEIEFFSQIDNLDAAIDAARKGET